MEYFDILRENRLTCLSMSREYTYGGIEEMLTLGCAYWITTQNTLLLNHIFSTKSTEQSSSVKNDHSANQEIRYLLCNRILVPVGEEECI
jgi:hypothetical protein